MRFLLTILSISLFTCSGALAYTHVKPVPIMPQFTDSISDITDSITYTLVSQVHRGLFSYEGSNEPVKDLVSDFRVKNGGKKYIFSLIDNLKFHNNAQLNSKEIVKTLRMAFKWKANYLAKKIGFPKVLRRPNYKAKKWLSIYSSGEDVVIEMSKPYAKLIYLLADPRLSIAYRGQLKIGLGSFQIDKITKNKVLLSRFSKEKVDSKLAERIVMKKLPLEEAVELVRGGKAHDLASYNVEPKGISSIIPYVNIRKTLFPRTYLFFINSDKYSLVERQAIASALDRAKLTEKCSLPGAATRSLVPKGFEGHLEAKFKRVKLPKKIEFKVYVPEEVGSEECIAKALNAMTDKNVTIYAKVGKYKGMFDKWGKKELDSIFVYVEAEADYSFFEYFLPSIESPFGKDDDLKAQKIFKRLVSEDNIQERQKLSKRIAKHLNDRAYFVPVYTPVNKKIAIHKSIELKQAVMLAPYQMKIKNMRRVNEKL